MALTGHLSDLSLSELIEFFCNQRKTGQLKVLYPQGPGHFYLQTGSVVDARIGVLRGIDAVYYALTLPNAKFEFGGESESTERTINQPWTQVVLEGLRRLDEGIVPPDAFPPDYHEQSEVEDANLPGGSVHQLEKLRVPAFLSLMGSDSAGKRKFAIAGAVAFVVIASVAVIGVPAGWYNRAKVSVASQPTTVVAETAAPAELPKTEVPETSSPGAPTDEAAVAARREREKERERARTRAEKAAALMQSAPPSANASKPGAKKITVTVTYDESGRVTQASGGDASAVRIARQKRFPAGKAGSATITIPIN
ncbi:MAG TPA: DUF4388 domain-containing protein [Pyrinomonadaceae bacterium]|nr:DUF4388 domain-containing protein [Pyrinomonadaceae bacterium]